ncbi:phosphate starvation-inducible protein PhoH [Enterobacter cloacae]|nr:phosphate starvation-inducible protein PhoH [Enterobacter cloacae]
MARNEAQAHYLNAIESKQLIFATGEAGCGKTWISAAKAAEALINKDVERIIVTRPVLQADEDLGFLPGDISEKFAPYFLTRLGENVTVIVNGDITQCDLPSGVKSGLSDAMSRFEEDEMIGVVRFTKEDCVRSALCQRTLEVYSD